MDMEKNDKIISKMMKMIRSYAKILTRRLLKTVKEIARKRKMTKKVYMKILFEYGNANVIKIIYTHNRSMI